MFLSTWNSQETARPHTLVAGFILVQIRALHDDDPNVVGVDVHPSIETGHELGECGMGPFTPSPQIAAMDTPLVGVS